MSRGYIFFWLKEVVKKNVNNFSLDNKDKKILKEGEEIIDLMLEGWKINNTLKLTKDSVDATNLYFLADKISQEMKIKDTSNFLKKIKDTLKKMIENKNIGKDKLKIMKDFFEKLEEISIDTEFRRII